MLSFYFFFSITEEMGSHYVSKAGLELLSSSNALASIFQVVGITGMGHLPDSCLLLKTFLPSTL
jgi:hypothetical protein